MPATLYIFNGSPPARTALITANAVGLPFDVHVFKGRDDLNTPEMLKINPQHTVPFLNDNGQIVSDSHAISAYLIEKYGKNDSLYPKDLHQRAIVNQRMFYDASVIFPCLSSILGGFMRKEYKTIPKEKIEPVQEVYKTLEKYLDGKKWIAGNNVTIADFSCGTTTSSLDFLHPIDKKVYPKVDDWLNRVKKLPYFKNDEQQFEHFKKFVYTISNWD
ncbi:hypothetical protein RN001_009613 [Aquatica leii]|uniref:Glutathione S-transferase n=1 Tax=Aquatica leii TaxID=1421715 RepID=A0AAN7P5H2_9COLE|nr:hypothetical protein RN001_009613 [Aquatica leii]